jgi:hypothetical protein
MTQPLPGSTRTARLKSGSCEAALTIGPLLTPLAENRYVQDLSFLYRIVCKEMAGGFEGPVDTQRRQAIIFRSAALFLIRRLRPLARYTRLSI